MFNCVLLSGKCYPDDATKGTYYVYIHIHIHIHINIHIYIYTYIHTTCIYIYMYINTDIQYIHTISNLSLCVCVCVCVCVLLSLMHTHTHLLISQSLSILSHLLTHPLLLAHTHTRTPRYNRIFKPNVACKQQEHTNMHSNRL